MRRNELSPDANAELDALDAIIAGEPVGEEHLELAALVASVRGDAPQIDAAFSARLEQRIAERFRRPRSRTARPRLALAGGSLVALIVTAVVVLSSGALSGTTTRPRTPLVELPKAAATPGVSDTFSRGGHASTGTALPSALASPAAPIVHHTGSLTLTTAATRIQDVANGIVANTERVGGSVAKSNVTVHGAASVATFSLSVPATKLPALISALSRLAPVSSVSQSTLNLTHSYDAVAAKLAVEKSERSALLKALAAATTAAQIQSIQHQISVLDGEIAATSDHADGLLAKGRNAAFAVNVRAAGAAAGGHARSGPVARALNDSLTVLDVALAIALVALATFLPIALCGLAVWWSAATLRQRARERALAASGG